MPDTTIVTLLFVLNLIGIVILITRSLFKKDSLSQKIDLTNEKISILSSKIDQVNSRINDQDKKIESVENVVAIIANSNYWGGADDFSN